jgi:ABC-2 type transport system ATP-binding protein
MADDLAIRVSNVNKTFKLPHEKNNSVKNAVINFYKRNKTYEKQQVLEDVSFNVKKGEFFGIVGRNGSGKSTLLKLLAGIYSPDKGSIEVNGKLTPFIELGVGFNPDLTGRENVFLNGALLGFNRKDMQKMYGDIVAFAELERFMDQKLKNYSSGMQVRLAFSIAIRANSEVLLLDEVLAVGDESFQRKCYDYFLKLKRDKQTVVLVTHDMGAIQKYCEQALMLESSRVIAVGKPREIALMYELANAQSSQAAGQSSLTRPSNPAVRVEGIHFSDRNTNSERFNSREDIELSLTLKVRSVQTIQINLYIVNNEGRYVAGINTTEDIGTYKPPKGNHVLRCTIAKGQLTKGDYTVNAGVYTVENNPSLIDIYDSSYGVECPRMFLTDEFEDRDGMFYLNAKWEKPKRTTKA